ncbi:MAG TPA: preprotein translocase subunit SecG [Bacillota bacterium]|nr:preprotein translocase subunit SecG [Bacillota bacterium]
MSTALLILLLVISVGLIAAVLLQSGRSAGLSGAISGGAETFFGKKKGVDDFLSRLTVILAVLFMALAIVMAYLQQSGH